MKILFLSLILVTFSANAEMTEVFEIWSPESSDENYLVLTNDGRVHEVSTDREDLVSKLQMAKDNLQQVELGFENTKLLDQDEVRKVILDVQVIESAKNYSEEDSYAINKLDVVPDPMANYEPTIVNSMEEAQIYFNSMRTRDRRKSQCYNRAYVWNYEMWQDFQVKSTKVWMFFTKRYIREFRYHWWFHVTPAIEVADQAQIITMDRKYMRGPTPLNEWKDFFIRNGAHCPMITKYAQYSRNQKTEYCYHIQSSMFFWQPFQIENLETRNWNIRKEFLPKELRVAYRNGFGLRTPRSRDYEYSPRPLPRRRWYNPRRWVN